MNGEIRYVLRCRTPNGHEWRVEVLQGSPVPGRLHEIRVFETDVQDRNVSLKLDIRSWLLYGWRGAWPPERALKLYNEDNSVILEYRDEWCPYDRYPDTSEWRARFDPRKRRWSLKRLRYLDYEKTDDLFEIEPLDFRNLK